MGIFREEYITANKRRARNIIWEAMVPRICYYGRRTPVMILPGRSTEEIDLACASCDRPKLYVYDMDPEAVRIVRERAAERVFKVEQRDVIDLPAGEWYVAASFDDCRVLGQHLVDRLRSVAARTVSALCVSCTVGRDTHTEDMTSVEIPALRHCGWSEKWHSRAAKLGGVLVPLGWHPCVFVAYKGHETPILTTLWTRQKTNIQEHWLLKTPKDKVR